MTAKPGEYYDANPDFNFTRFFCRYLKESDGTVSLSYVIRKAAQKELRKRKIQQEEPLHDQRPAAKDIRLQPPSVVQDEDGEESEDESTDDEIHNQGLD